jgi:rhamnosyltransferase
MKIAAYVCYFEDKEAVVGCVRALMTQSRPPEEILVVDNGSQEPLASNELPRGVIRLCHQRNLGTSGAAATAFEYALERDYDALWVLDQDSRPRADALEKLLRLHDSFSREERRRIGILATCPVLDGEPLYVRLLLSPRGLKQAPLNPEEPFGECDTAIWSGSLYRIDAVRKVGLPRFGRDGHWHDFALDYGDLEFGFRIKEAGYKVLVHPSSFLDHRIGSERRVRWLGRTLVVSDHPLQRRYLSARNMVYFWLYLHPRRRLLGSLTFLSAALGKGMLVTLLVETDPWPKIGAWVRGARDGVFKRLDRKF